MIQRVALEYDLSPGVFVPKTPTSLDEMITQPSYPGNQNQYPQYNNNPGINLGKKKTMMVETLVEVAEMVLVILAAT